MLPGKHFNEGAQLAAVLGTGAKLQLTRGPAKKKKARANKGRPSYYYLCRKPRGDSLPCLWRSLTDCAVPCSSEGSLIPKLGTERKAQVCLGNQYYLSEMAGSLEMHRSACGKA